MTTAENIRHWRETKKLSLREVAERIGVSYQCVQQYELGTRQPGLEQLKKIAAAIGVKPEKLL